MGHSIKPERINEEIIAPVNTYNNSITSSINAFNAQIKILGDGKTWKGGSASTNVSLLVGFYKDYVTYYNEFVNAMSTAFMKFNDSANQLFTTNRGNGLTFDSIKSMDLNIPNIPDLTAEGESGDVTILEDCAKNFKTYATEIANSYLKIRNVFEEKVGAVGPEDSRILDTSDFGTDHATNLKNDVISIIDNLKKINDTEFNQVITDIETAAKNIRNA